MLTPEQLDKYPDNLVRLYSNAEKDIIADIARRIATYDYFIPSAEWQYKKLIEMGNVHDEILQTLSQMTGYTKGELKSLMEEAGYQAIKADDEIYKNAGLNPSPLGQSPALQDVLNAGIKNTNGLFENLTRTTARTGSKQFEHILDNAYMQITSGAFDYNTAIRNAVKDLARNGVAAIEYPGGRINYIESAVRRAVITGIGQTIGKMQEIRAEEMGCDLVEVTAHAGARPSHAEWQGKIFSRSGNHPKYPDFKKSTGYGTGPGLKGWECHHDFFPFFEGLSEPAYTKEQLKDYKAKNITYNGEKIDEYTASQKQRYIERQIRRWKREEVGMNVAGLSTDEAAAKVAYWQARQRDFIKQTGLKRQNAREQIGGISKSPNNILKSNKPLGKPKTIDEIENKIRDISGANANIKKMDTEVANDYLEGIEKFYKEYPQLKGYVSEINNSVSFGASGSTNVQFGDGKSATFKPKVSVGFGNETIKEYKESIKFNIDTGFKYAGSSGISTAMHELTHSLEFLVQHTEKGLYKNGEFIEQNVFSKTKDFETLPLSKKIYKQAVKEVFGAKAGYSDYKDAIAFLGDYAKSNADEMIAQCVSYELTGQTNPFSAKVKELFDKKVKDVLG